MGYSPQSHKESDMTETEHCKLGKKKGGDLIHESLPSLLFFKKYLCQTNRMYNIKSEL